MKKFMLLNFINKDVYFLLLLLLLLLLFIIIIIVCSRVPIDNWPFMIHRCVSPVNVIPTVNVILFLTVNVIP